MTAPAPPTLTAARGQTTTTGIVTALVGFTSSFAVVLAGLRATGADPDQAAVGLVTLCVLQGAGTVWLSRRHRIPVTLAWSTPGAALLVAASGTASGWPAAVGAFAVTGLLIAATGLWARLGRLVAAIPVTLAQAMLAGVLLPLCLAPVHALTATPLVVAPVVAVWLLVHLLAPRWAAPAAFVVALGVALVVGVQDGTQSWPGLPSVTLTMPVLDGTALLGLALPLWIVTMASQNVPGVAVLAAAGYTAPWRPTMLLTGFGTVLGAPAGAHAVNLAAITAALPASPEAHPDPAERWRASAAAGWTYLVLAPLAPALVSLVAGGPPGLVESVAGLALLSTFAAALLAAVSDPDDRVAAVVALLLAASGVTIWGVGSAFWALVAGLLMRTALRASAARRGA